MNEQTSEVQEATKGNKSKPRSGKSNKPEAKLRLYRRGSIEAKLDTAASNC